MVIDFVVLDDSVTITTVGHEGGHGDPVDGVLLYVLHHGHTALLAPGL